MSDTPLQIAVIGASGRMGLGLLDHIFDASDLAVSAALGRADDPQLGRPLRPNTPALSDDLDALEAADVAIDFSSPAGCLAAVEAARRFGTPLVTGTTGLDATQSARRDAAAEVIALLPAANCSVGVNLLLGLVQQAARGLGAGWDPEIVETHHRHKRDAPSGTALALAYTLAEARGWSRDAVVDARAGADALRGEDEIGVVAMRGGDVVGEHLVSFFGAGERVELAHRATDRGIFVRGALRAARWLASRQPGLYSMQDVLFGS